MEIKFRMRLFIAGRTARSERCIANLRKICEHELQGKYHLEVIDVLEEPERAEQERVLATPTLVKDVPPPTRRIIGDMSDVAQVLIGLDLNNIVHFADPGGGSS